MGGITKMTTTETKRRSRLTKGNLILGAMIGLIGVMATVVLYVFTVFAMHGRVFP